MVNLKKKPGTSPGADSQQVSYPKSTYSRTVDGARKTYGTIDIWMTADDDYGGLVSWLVSGGSNSLEERDSSDFEMSFVVASGVGGLRQPKERRDRTTRPYARARQSRRTTGRVTSGPHSAALANYGVNRRMPDVWSSR